MIFHRLRSFLAVVLACSLTLQSVPAAALSVERVAFGSRSLEISPRFGRILSNDASPSAKRVVLIQDLHVNSSVQTNIRKLLQSISKQLNATEAKPLTVGVEGAVGEFDFSLLYPLAHPGIRETILQKEFENGYVSGAELAAVDCGGLHSTLKLVGIDDAGLYRRNLMVYGNPPEFYRTAKKRDAVFAGHLLQLLKTDPMVVAVVGGFHTDGLMRRLKQADIAVTVIQPNVAALESGIYERRLAEEWEISISASNPDSLAVAATLFVGASLVPGFGGRTTRRVLDSVAHLESLTASLDHSLSYFNTHGALLFGGGSLWITAQTVLITTVVLMGATAVLWSRGLLGGNLMQATAGPLGALSRGLNSLFSVADSPDLGGGFGSTVSPAADPSETMKGKTVVDVALEIALPPALLEKIRAELGEEAMRLAALSTSVGGIGPLLKERILAQAKFGLNSVGVSLLYDYVWSQEIDPETGSVFLKKREVGSILKKVMKQGPRFSIKMPDADQDGRMIDVEIQAWEADYGNGSRTYFLEHLPKHENRVTTTIYPGGVDLGEIDVFRSARARSENDHIWMQRYLLGRGTLALMRALHQQVDVLVMSEVGAALAHPKLIEDEFKAAPEFDRMVTVFNDHTPLEYAHPKFSEGILKLFRFSYRYWSNDPRAFGWVNFGSVDRSKWMLDFTRLMISISDGAYGVAKKHGDVMRKMPTLRVLRDQIVAVTNGVGLEDWQAPELGGWEKSGDSELLATKAQLKNKMLDWIVQRIGRREDWKARVKNMAFFQWTRRIVPYKRLGLVLDIIRNPQFRQRFLATNQVLVIGGRLHQNMVGGQEDVLNQILELLRDDPELRDRIIFIPDFNIAEAPILFQGANGAIMLADDGREASATGFMKALMNGNVVIASDDGAIPEFIQDGENGFIVPYEGEVPTAGGLLDALERYEDQYRDPSARVRMMRAALAKTPDARVDRTVRDAIQLYGSTLLKKADRQNAYEAGYREGWIMRRGVDLQLVRSLRSALSEVRFAWKYRTHEEGTHHEAKVYTDGANPKAGLEGFVAQFHYVMEQGMVGEWALRYHTHHVVDGRWYYSDFVQYALTTLETAQKGYERETETASPSGMIQSIRTELVRLDEELGKAYGESVQRPTDREAVERVIQLNYQLFGLIRALIEPEHGFDPDSTIPPFHPVLPVTLAPGVALPAAEPPASPARRSMTLRSFFTAA